MSGEAVYPCEQHESILSVNLPWHRALEIAADCPDCKVET